MANTENKGFLDVISVDVENVNLKDESKKESVFYRPKQDGKEPYKALIRFLPIPKMQDDKLVGVEAEPYYMKRRYWLTDEMGNGNYYDSPSTIDEKCPIQTTFFRLHNSDDIREKSSSKKLNLSTHFWSLVYIIDDKQNEELNGKTLIWRCTRDIKKLIDKELEEGDEYKKTQKTAVWDLLVGKNLLLKVGIKKFVTNNKERIAPDYGACEFLDVEPLKVDGYELKKGDAKSNKLSMELLQNVPKEMFDIKYQPWSNEVAEEVNKILVQFNKSISNETSTETDENSVSNETNTSEKSSGMDEADNIMKNLDF